MWPRRHRRPAQHRPLLAALADNGGPTLTHLPSAFSPAGGVIPVGTAGLCDGTRPDDQRGTARPQGAACDAGAVEYAEVEIPDVLTVDDGGDGSDATPGDGVCDDGTGACTLRAAVVEANALPGTQTVDITVPAVTLSLTGTDAGGDLDVTDGLTVDGNGATVTQTVADRVIEATAGTLTVRDLVVTGGDTTGDGGGMLLHATATLERVTVTGSTATSAGGGVAVTGDVTIVDSTISATAPTWAVASTSAARWP